jgi:hypothetical protein
MRNLLALAAAIVVIVAVVGWYQGWYKVKTEVEPDGHREVTIDIDRGKVGEDLNKGKTKVKELIDNRGGAKVPGSVSQASPSVPPPPPQDLVVPGGASGPGAVNQAAWTLPELTVPPPPSGGAALPGPSGQLPPTPPGGPVLAPPPPPGAY